MNKKLIIIVAAAGLISFGGAFAFSWFTRPRPSQEEAADVEQTTETTRDMNQLDFETLAKNNAVKLDSKTKKAMTEKQLKQLVYDVREKIREYDARLNELAVREQQLEKVHGVIKEDITKLEKLRIELNTTISRIKKERDKLLKSTIEVSQIEKNNLATIAATYDKMDSVKASKILSIMHKSQKDGGEDAIKILFYMGERNRAELIANLADEEPALAAHFSRRLKQIAEKN